MILYKNFRLLKNGQATNKIFSTVLECLDHVIDMNSSTNALNNITIEKIMLKNNMTFKKFKLILFVTNVII